MGYLMVVTRWAATGFSQKEKQGGRRKRNRIKERRREEELIQQFSEHHLQ